MRRRHRRRHIEHPLGTTPGTLTQRATEFVHSGAESSRSFTIEVIAWNDAQMTSTRVESVGQIPAARNNLPNVWINIDGHPSAPELEELGVLFNLHPLALEDVLHPVMRAKVEPFDRFLFVVAPIPRTTLEPARAATAPAEFESEQLAVFIGEDFVVSIQDHPGGDCLDPVRGALHSQVARPRFKHPSHLAFAIFDAVIDHYFPLVNALSDRLDTLEATIIDQRAAPDIYAIREVRHELARVRQALWPMRDALTAMISMEQWFDLEQRLFLRNALDHVMRLIDMIESDRSCAGDLMELAIALANAKLGEVTKVLTMIATIFIPITFIASIYGMNFEFMPELKSPWGYPTALAAMLVTAGGFLIMFWRRGWFEASMRRWNRGASLPGKSGV